MPTPQTRRYPLWRLLRANAHDLRTLLRESWVGLVGFALVALLVSAYLMLLYPATPDSPRPTGFGEAFYEAVKLLIFNSSLRFPTEDLLGEALFFATPLLGLTLLFQSVLNFGRLLLDKADRREAWQVSLASTYRDHIVLVGLGRVGLRIVNQLLDAGYRVVVIERTWDSEFVTRALALPVPVVHGDGREPLVLRDAGVLRARALVTAINDDLLNIEIGLTARTMRPELRTILRIFSDDLDRNLERSFGPNAAFSPSALAAPTMAAAAVSREIDAVIMTGNTPLGVTRLLIEEDGAIDQFVRAVAEQRGVRVLALRRNQQVRVLPKLSERLGAGDEVTLIGPVPQIEALRDFNRRGGRMRFLMSDSPDRLTEKLDTVIICGLGRVGYRVVRQLHRMDPRPRIVVVHTGTGPDSLTHRVEALDGLEFVVGDARERDVLLRAGIDRAYSVAALTSEDALNLQIALTARRFRADIHIVLRVFSEPLADRLADMFGIRTAYSTSALAAPTLAAAAALGHVHAAFNAAGQLFAAGRVELPPGHALVGQSVGAILEQRGALVVGLRRNEQSTPLPPLDLTLADGDRVTILAPLDVLAQLRGG